MKAKPSAEFENFDKEVPMPTHSWKERAPEFSPLEIKRPEHAS